MVFSVINQERPFNILETLVNFSLCHIVLVSELFKHCLRYAKVPHTDGLYIQNFFGTAKQCQRPWFQNNNECPVWFDGAAEAGFVSCRQSSRAATPFIQGVVSEPGFFVLWATTPVSTHLPRTVAKIGSTLRSSGRS